MGVDRQPHPVHPDSPHGPAARHGSPHRPSSVDFDAELRLHNEALRRAWGVRRHDRVLDVGCGTGQTTREAARVAAEGGALGVDVSVAGLDR
jgi:SAM-dependent methyltransferase